MKNHEAYLRDFPPDSLGEYEVEAIHPDDFVLDLLDLSPTAVVSAVQEQTRALKNPPRTLVGAGAGPRLP